MELDEVWSAITRPLAKLKELKLVNQQQSTTDPAVDGENTKQKQDENDDIEAECIESLRKTLPSLLDKLSPEKSKNAFRH
tara:strand:- start:942 stop:1181 length:240 start_codon:yes stop_codon:yes gene_type:complete